MYRGQGASGGEDRGVPAIEPLLEAAAVACSQEGSLDATVRISLRPQGCAARRSWSGVSAGLRPGPRSARRSASGSANETARDGGDAAGMSPGAALGVQS